MKNITPINNNTRSERPQALKGAVIALLVWTEELYANYQYKTGLKYLKSYLDGDEHFADQLSRSKVFWAWWRNHWANRDESFSARYSCINYNLDQLRNLYLEHNKAETLAECIHPNSVILNETYADMITDVVKEEL